MFYSENHKNKQTRRRTKKMQISFNVKLMVTVATTLLHGEDFSQQEWWGPSMQKNHLQMCNNMPRSVASLTEYLLKQKHSIT